MATEERGRVGMLPSTRLTLQLATPTFPFVSSWWTIFGVWHLIAILLVVRRLGGAFVQPLSGWSFVAVAGLVIALSGLLRVCAVRFRLPVTTRTKRLLMIAPTIAALLMLSSITVHGSSLYGALVAWGLVIATETAWLSRFIPLWRSAEQETERNGASRRFFLGGEEPIPIAIPDAVESHGDLNDESLPDGVTQQIVRSRHPDGETLAGLLRVEFAADERTQIVHIAFCPPFEGVPKVDVAQISGPDVSVKVTDVESFGTRIEVKHRESEAKPCSAVLEIEATAPRIS
jgi:hypothetical protein